MDRGHNGFYSADESRQLKIDKFMTRWIDLIFRRYTPITFFISTQIQYNKSGKLVFSHMDNTNDPKLKNHRSNSFY